MCSAAAYSTPACFGLHRCTNFSVFVHRVHPSRKWSLGLPVAWAGDWEYNQYMSAALRLSRVTFPYLTANASGACVTLVAGLPMSVGGEIRGPKALRWLARLPNWNGGLNHIVVDTTDSMTSTAQRGAGFPVGRAILLKSSVQSNYHRPHFDVVVPLPPRKVYSVHTRWNATNRSRLLCWKGQVNSNKKVRARLLLLNNNVDILIGRRERTRLDYDDLMRTCRFVLAPRGTGLHSFRLLEILSAGAVPVIVADGAVKPFSSLLQWGAFSIDIREVKLAALPALLRAMPEHRWQQLRDTGRCVYERYFVSEGGGPGDRAAEHRAGGADVSRGRGGRAGGVAPRGVGGTAQRSAPLTCGPTSLMAESTPDQAPTPMAGDDRRRRLKSS
eukprot:GGOE01021211.1.p1 GENE.GGOE01021211.1~~GGOE01021211.1.p1  ORF type:complete len:386 (-),score=62.14 GGOE01021211.1:87-1244(-)